MNAEQERERERKRPVVCAGCGRTALKGDGITAGGETWWELWPPFEVAYAAGEILDQSCVAYVCSPDCAVGAIEKLRPHYERIEEELVNHPQHIHDEGGRD